MKTSNYLILSIIFQLLFNLPLLSRGIEFNISLNKKSFLERETIWVKCTVTNNGNSPQKILLFNDVMLERIRFFLIPEDTNNLINPIVIFVSSFSEPLVLVEPADSIVAYANLLQKVESAKSLQQKEIEFLKKRGLLNKGDLPPLKPRLHSLVGYLKPGRYKLQACYPTRWYEKDGREDIYSDTLEFEIMPSIGEEKEALQLLEKGKYIELFEKYPESIYAHCALHDYVYKRSLSSLNRQERENLIEVFMKQFKKYPNSPTIKYLDLQAFLQLHLDMGILKEGRTKLKNISEKNPDSYLSKMIKDFLKSTERNSIYSIEDTTKEYKNKRN